MRVNLCLNMKGFEPFLLYMIGDGANSKEYVFRFENDFGARVWKNPASRGYLANLWELRIVHFDGDDDIRDLTTIRNDYVLTDAHVRKLLKKIKEL